MVFIRVIFVCIGLMVAMHANAGDLAQATALGEPIEKVKKKYSLEQMSCSEDENAACRDKFKSNCECYKSRIVQYANKSQTMFFTVNKGTIVEFVDQRRTSMPALYEPFMGFVEAFSGDEKPDEVYASEPKKDDQSYALRWKRGDSFYRVNAVCPLTMYGGKMQLKTKLKKCYSGTIVASKIQQHQPVANWKKVEAEY